MLAVTNDGGVLIGDWAAAAVVRNVSADETITRLAGTEAVGNTGNDGPATAALLQGRRALAMTADGFLITDAPNRVVRKVSKQPN